MRCSRQFGRIDILVNNAGTHLRGTVESTTLDILERQLRDKVFGFFSMIQAVLPTMKAQRDGRIVNIVGPGRAPSASGPLSRPASPMPR